MKRRRFFGIFNIAITLIAVFGVLHGVIKLSHAYVSALVAEDSNSDFDRATTHRILFLSSMNSADEGAQNSAEFLHHIFYEKKFSFDAQYMDMLNFNTKENVDLFYSHLKYKLEHCPPYDAIIMDGEEAAFFAVEHQKELFDNTPMVFLGVTDAKIAEQLSENPFVTGVVPAPYIKDTIDVAIRLFPYASTIYAIFDDSLFGRRGKAEFLAAQKYFPGYTFQGINASEYSRDFLAERIESINKNAILLALPFRTDSEKNMYITRDNTNFVLAHAHVPVFSGDFAAIGDGFIGGKVDDFRTMTEKTAQIVIDILEGQIDLASMEGYEVTDSGFLFNDYVMKKYDVSTQLLDDYDVTFVNKSLRYWEFNRPILLPVVEILFFLLALVLILATQIFELYTSERRIKSIALHDTHTGLANRYSIHRKLEEIMRRKIKFAVILIDLEDFKSINDFNSHDCGDYILKQLAERLQELVNDGNYEVARYYGDKFFLIYKGAHMDSSDPEIYFLRQLLGNAIEYKDKTFFISTNIGIVNSNDVYTSDDYFINADIAMNEAKLLGKNKYVLFTDVMKSTVLKNAEIGQLLEDACQNEGFTVLYQPQINTMTGELRGYEALVRLSNQLIMPSNFIPIAEKDGHIAKIGRIVTEKVIKQMAEWRDSGMELHKVSINFSVGQIGDKSYIPYLKKLLSTYDIPAHLIGIEITESLFLSNKTQALDLFKQFEEIGIKIALDDFGTGYSSLNYLTYLPIETVKIDKSTVDFYLDGKAGFIEHIVNLVHCLGMDIIIEGVEEQWQYEKLKSFKCDYIQGYFFSEPLTGEQVKNFVQPVFY